MAESKVIQAIANQAAVQAATAVVMAQRKEDAEPRSGTNTASPRVVHIQRH